MMLIARLQFLKMFHVKHFVYELVSYADIGYHKARFKTLSGILISYVGAALA